MENTIDKTLLEKSNCIMTENGLLSIGDTVETIKGGRISGINKGEIVGWGKWRHYQGAKVKREDGSIKLYLIKNLKKLQHVFFLSTKYKLAKVTFENDILIHGGESFKSFEGKNLKAIKDIHEEAKLIQLT